MGRYCAIKHTVQLGRENCRSGYGTRCIVMQTMGDAVDGQQPRACGILHLASKTMPTTTDFAVNPTQEGNAGGQSVLAHHIQGRPSKFGV